MEVIVSRSTEEHPYEDHFRSTYSPKELATLDRVQAFNRELVEAFESGTDVRAVTRLIDPDPLRYMWVDEGDGEVPRYLDAASAVLAKAPVIPGHQRLTAQPIKNVANASAPSAALGPDGSLLLSWIEWADGVGERVVAVRTDPSGAADVQPHNISGELADCFRPTAVFDSNGNPWVFYGISRGAGAEVRAHSLGARGWSDPFIVSTGRPAFNQEVAALPGGGLVCCWQQWIGGRFAILARSSSGGDWNQPMLVSGDGDDNVWDPVIAVSPHGQVTIAWCSYREGSYRIVSRMMHDGRLTPERVLSAGTDYCMHPTLACTTNGDVWCAFDRLTVQAHGGSGTTKLRPTSQVGDSRPIDGTLPPGRHFPSEVILDLNAAIELVRIDRDALFRVPGVARGLDIVPAGYPRLAATGDGGLAVTFRAVRRLPLITYYWEVGVQTLGPEGLSDPMTFASSDGPPEEADIVGGADAAVVVWQHDGRRDKALVCTEGYGGRECLHLRQHYGSIVWHSVHDKGQVSSGVVRSRGPAIPSDAERVSGLSSSGRVETRPWLESRAARYQTSIAGSKYQLYWGDLHRHSLISRCTAADEPTLDDYYRYSQDIFGYDFWALTDHAENTSARHWWCIQKAADLLRVDNDFVPFYGFEWTSWSGHQNVIFGPCQRGAPIISAFAEGSDKPDKLWALLRANPDFPAITIPHHPGSAMTPFNWDYFDPEYMRLVEIFQACRGNYEDLGCFRQFNDGTVPGHFVVDALKRNYRFGLIASTDHGFGASYVGVFSPSLDRKSIFESMRARRTIAATTRGIVVDFRIGDTFMGGEVRLPGPAVLEAYVKGYREISRLDIVRNGEVVHRADSPPDLPKGWLRAELRIEWGGARGTTDWSGAAELAGGEFVQSQFWSPEITAVSKHQVRWHSIVPKFGEHHMFGEPKRGGIEVTVVGPPDAVLSVSTGPAEIQARLSEVVTGKPMEATGASGARLRVQSGTGALVGMNCSEKRVTWVDEFDRSAWYYVRTILIDGEMAWSSPIWVDRA